MGWPVSRHSEPGRKLDPFERRLGTLRGLVKRGEGAGRIASAAEKLRLAGLAVVKAQRALIREYPQRDPDGRWSRNLDEDERRWLARSAGEIAEEFGGSDA
jgi:hypothetical protein